jgi:hypothetical protein
MVRSEYARQRLAQIENEQPAYTDWWHSGTYWYCTVLFQGGRASGAGVTKDDARRDAMNELRKRRGASNSGHEHAT